MRWFWSIAMILCGVWSESIGWTGMIPRHWYPAFTIGAVVLFHLYWLTIDLRTHTAPARVIEELRRYYRMEIETKNIDPTALFLDATGEPMEGHVKYFNREKGYGFIAPSDGGKDIFVTHMDVEMAGFRYLLEGEYVQFEMARGAKGPQAIHVRRIR